MSDVMINMYQNFTCMGVIQDIESTINATGRDVLRFFLKHYNTDGKELYCNTFSCIMFDAYAHKRVRDLKNGDFVLVSGTIRENHKVKAGFSIKIDYIKHLDPIYRNIPTLKGGAE